jgi:DNA-binding XRE family transcriptional regulator
MPDNKERPRTAPTAGGMDTPEVTGMSVRKRRGRAPERGQQVAAARKRAGLSQQALADRTGLAKSTIARIELGQHQPSVGVALAISRELAEPVEALFGGAR